MKGMMGTGRIACGRLVTLSALFALVLAFGPAFAATIVVPNDEPTIQAGVDAAASGDTVLVKKGKGIGNKGVYHEDVEIFNKSITLKCEKGATLDGAIPSDLSGGPAVLDGEGVHIRDKTGGDGDADGSKVINCTIQNFSNQGIEVEDADDVTIMGNTLVNNEDDGLLIEDGADDALVKNNTAIHNHSDGFDIDGDDHTIIGNVAIGNTDDGFSLNDGSNKRFKILRNRALDNDGDGFHIHGDDHTIVGNRAENNDDHGFDLGDGFDRNFVANNLARGNDEDGFRIGDADDNTYLRNVAIDNSDGGFDHDSCSNDANKFERNIAIGNEEEGFISCGDRNEFVNNRSIENQEEGFKLDCDEDDDDPDDECTGPIIGNRAIRNADEEGFDLRDFEETTISRNHATGNAEEGFRLNNVRKTLIENNLARDNGREGFKLSDGSNTNTLKSNRSIGNARDGFRISCCDSGTNTLIKNTATRNFGDGIDLDGDSTANVIDGNTVKNNRGTGIENDGKDDTIIKNNTMKGNRTDLAGRGDVCDGGFGAAAVLADSATDGGGNTSVTGGFGVCTPGTGDE